MPVLTIKTEYSDFRECFVLEGFVEGYQIFIIFYKDTSGRYKEYKDSKKINFNNNTIIFKEIFNKLEDYEHYISQIIIKTYGGYNIDFSDYKFISLNKYNLCIMYAMISIINLDTTSIKKLHISYANSNTTADISDFINRFIELKNLTITGFNMGYNVDIREIIKNMKKLEKLKIYGGHNITINDDSFGGLEKLTNIELFYCKVESLKSFENIHSLESLNIFDATGLISKSSLMNFAEYLKSNPSIIECNIYPTIQ